MDPEFLDRMGRVYREEWYTAKGYPLVMSWNALPEAQKQQWISDAIAFDNDSQQEEVA